MVHNWLKCLFCSMGEKIYRKLHDKVQCNSECVPSVECKILRLKRASMKKMFFDTEALS